MMRAILFTNVQRFDKADNQFVLKLDILRPGQAKMLDADIPGTPFLITLYRSAIHQRCRIINVLFMQSKGRI